MWNRGPSLDTGGRDGWCRAGVELRYEGLLLLLLLLLAPSQFLLPEPHPVICTPPASLQDGEPS